MRQFRPSRTIVLLGLTLASVAGSSQAAFPLKFQDEDAAWFGAMVVDVEGSTTLTTLGLTQPMFCANLIAPTQGTRLAAVLPGFSPTFGDFKFGPLDTTNSARPQLSVGGVKDWRYTSGGLEMQPYEDALDCYVLTTSGVHKATPNLFDDSFSAERTGPNASVVSRVVALPDGENNYKYFIDVSIPADFAGRNYVVTDGFDSSVFSSDISQYCAPASTSATTCAGQTVFQNNVDNRGVVPAGGLSKRFIVLRPLKSGVFSLPSDPNVMLTASTLFIAPPTTAGQPVDVNLSDNVSIGRAVLSDLDPVITASAIPVFSEGTAATGQTFILTDDTSESGLPQLGAAVTVNFNGTEVPATNVSCTLGTPQAGEVTRRNCTYDIPVFDPNFATDVTPGTYVANVSASVRIVATDGRGQTTTRILPLHVAGADNDAPSFALNKILEDPSAQNGNLPTLRCVIHPNEPPDDTPQCQGQIDSFVQGLLPGPARAYDEIATQTTSFVGLLSSNRLSCSGSSPSIFAFNGASSPRFVFNGGRTDLSYDLGGNLGHSDCVITVSDANFPAGQSAAQTQVSFRILTVAPPQ